MYYESLSLHDCQPILVFGCDGQVGLALKGCLEKQKTPAIFLRKDDCDLLDETCIRSILSQYQPRVVINAAAYTNVTGAEGMVDQVFAINTIAPEIMANYMINVDHGLFIQYSTDYVFSDTKSTKHLEEDVTGPANCLGVYGQSKFYAERYIEDIFNNSIALNNYSRYLILRTSWVYGAGENFITRILRQLKGCEDILVVNDQVGVPTFSEWLAEVTVLLMSSAGAKGIYHVVPDGEVSRSDLARYIKEVSVNRNLEGQLGKIHDTVTDVFESKKIRPLNSRMSNEKLKNFIRDIWPNRAYPYPGWQDQLKQYIINL